MIRVLICDDQEVVREGLRTIVDLVPDFDVVAVVENGARAVDFVSSNPVDVVLMDLRMPVMNGIQATREIVNKHSDVAILVLTTYAEESWVLDAIRAGASGYLLKDAPRERLVDAIRGTAAGQAHLDPSVAGSLVTRIAKSPAAESDTGVTGDLSERELDVLRLLARGLSNADIAEKLFLSEGTVRNYVSSILSKLGVEDRTQAAVLAVRHGIG